MSPTRVHAGDSTYGTLLIFAQAHRTMDANDPLANEPRVAQSQALILAALLRLHPPEVFFEGHTDAHVLDALPPEVTRACNQAFAGWTLSRGISSAQAKLLSTYGANVVYKCLAPNTVFLVTEEAQLIESILEPMMSHGVPLAAQLGLARDAREAFYVQQLKQYFSAHPGGTAVFVLGAAHDLIRQCSPTSGFNPRVLWYNTSTLPTAEVLALQREVYSVSGAH